MTARQTAAATLKKSFLASLTASVAAAMAIAAAPAAGASAAQCRESGGAKVCQRPGHTSLHAKPTPRNPNGSLFSNAWLPGYGRGHLPPLLALD